MPKRKFLFPLMALLLVSFLLLAGCSALNQQDVVRSGDESLPVVVDLSREKEPADAQAVLKVHFIDVGQGDCILVQTPLGQNLLIDGGEKESGGRVADYLEEQGVKRLAVLIGTHPHSDHIGGLKEIIDRFAVDEVYMPRVVHSTNTYKELLQTIKAKELQVTAARAGVELSLEGIKAQFIAPVAEEYKDLNNYSAVLRINYGNTVFLFMGDAEKESEEDILRSGTSLRADVLKVGHHGSASSSSGAFIAAVSPAYAVIMCGLDNDYGHPHQETLAVLEDAGSEILRTDQAGKIVMNSDGQKIEVENKFCAPVKDSSQNAGNADLHKYIGNINSKKFHRYDCKSLPSEKNRIYFNHRDEGASQGYGPCKSCNP